MIITTANQGANGTLPQNATNGNKTAPVKWFSLQDNTLNGTYMTMPSDGSIDTGWWGTSISDSNGYIPEPSVIKVWQSRAIWSVEITGFDIYNEYPVDFKVELFKAEALVASYSFTDNHSTSVKYNLPTPVDVDMVAYTFYRVNKPGRSVRILEVLSGFEIIRRDTLSFNLTDGIAEGKTLTLEDINKLTLAESKDITNRFMRPDKLRLDVIEKSEVDNPYSNKLQRKVYGKVEISYTDPFSDETVHYVASETGRGTSVSELTDRIETAAYKWFSLDGNSKLDNTFHPLPTDKRYSIGWWTARRSDGWGFFDPAPTISVSFSPRAITILQVVGDDKVNVFPTDFTIQLYEGTTLKHTETIVDNDAVAWHKVIEPVLGVDKLVLTLSKINKAATVGRITEMLTIIKETYEAELEGFRILEETGYVTGSLPIGNVSSNEIDVYISNEDRRFDLNNDRSPLYGYIRRNRRLVAWLGLEIANKIEWYQQGTYWTTQWDIASTSLSATVTARDRLEVLRNTDFTISVVYYNKTLRQLFEIVLLDAGLTSQEYVLDPELSSVVIPFAWFSRMTHREAIQRLAACGIIQVYCDKYGRIAVNIKVDATPTVMLPFSDSTNVISSKFPLAVTEQVNYVEVVARQLYISTSEDISEVNETVDVPANETVRVEYDLGSDPIVSLFTPVIEASTGITVSSYTVYSWGVVIEYTNSTSTAGSVTKAKFVGQLLKEAAKQRLISKDDQMIKDDGKVAVNMEHDFIQNSQYGQQLADTILDLYKDSRSDVTLENRGFPTLRLGDKTTYKDNEYAVVRQNLDWFGYLSAVTECKKL